RRATGPAATIRRATLRGHPYGRGGEAGNAFAAAQKAETLGGRPLDADPARLDPQDFGDPVAHGLAVWSDPGLLADQRHIHMNDLSAFPSHQYRRVTQEEAGVGAPPA